MDKMRVLLADDHPLLRSGLRALLDAQPDMIVIGEADRGDVAVRTALELCPDVVVMDIAMPGLGGAEATRQIKQARPEVKVLTLTAHEERGYAQLLLEAGASGYVLKRAAADELVRALQTVATGGMYLDSVAAPLVTPSSRRPGQEGVAPRAELSERESEVLRLIAQGHPMKEIAARLELSPRTLETYKARAQEKLGLRNRADIVRYALQRGWLSGD